MRHILTPSENVYVPSPKTHPFHYREAHLRQLREMTGRPAPRRGRKNVDSYLTELANRRRARGLTQCSVATAAGVRQSHISRIENLESRGVAFDTVIRYAHALGLEFKLVEVANAASDVPPTDH